MLSSHSRAALASSFSAGYPVAKEQNVFVAQAARAFAHDIAAPLQSLCLLVDASDNGRHIPPDFFHQLNQCTRYAMRLAHTWMELTPSSPPQPVALDALLSDVVQIFFPQHAFIEVAASPAPIVGWDHLLSRLVQNLVQNAITAGASRIGISVYPRKDHGACLIVRDDGPGLTPQQLASLRRGLLRSSKPEGGMGLRICEIIVAHHCGSWTCSSHRGDTRFIINLPPYPHFGEDQTP